MALRSVKLRLEDAAPFTGVEASVRPQGFDGGASCRDPSQSDVLQELLAFATLSQQVHSRAALINRRPSAVDAHIGEFGAEQFGLDEVLRLVTEYAVMITAADGVAIALAEDNEIVLRASAGTIAPDLGARIDRDSAFSGACIRTAQIISSDDTEADSRVNQEACRQLGARSMVAVPLESRGVVFGLLEAFSTCPSGFTSEDFRNLILLAELVSRTLTPEDESHLTASARIAAAKLEVTNLQAASSASVRDVAGVPDVAGKGAARQAEGPHAPDDHAPGDQVSEEIEPVESGFGAGPALDEPVLQAVRTGALDKSISSLRARVLDRGSAGHRHRVLLLLVCIGIAAALVAGIWWMQSRRAAPTTVTQRVQSPQLAQGPAPSGTVGHPAVATAHAAPGPANVVVNRSASPAKPVRATVGAGSENALPAYRTTVQELQKFPRVTGIQPATGPDSTTVVVNLESQAQYEAHRLTEPDRIYFDLPSTQLPPELFGKSIEFHDSLLKRIRVSQPVPGLTRVVLETSGAPIFSASTNPTPFQLVIELRSGELRAKP